MKLWSRIAAFVSWHRRIIAALCAALCVAGIVAAAQAPPPPGEPVVAARDALPPGHRITDADLTVVDAPSHLVTGATVLRPADAVGSTTAVGLDAGQPLTEHALIRGGAAEVGRALVPIDVPDGDLRSLLQPGMTVSLVLAFGEAPEVLTDDARVATLGAAPAGTLGGAQSGRGIVVVDVDADLAPAIAVLGQSGQLAIVLGRA